MDGVVEYGASTGQGNAATEPVLADTSRPTVCTIEPVGPDFERERVLHTDSIVPLNAVFFFRVCGDVRQLDHFVPGDSDPAEDEQVGFLVAEAFASLVPSAPQVVTSPPLGSEIATGFPMYLAVDEGSFETLTGEVSAGQFTVRAEVTPVETRFVPGDQADEFVCEGAGSVWSPGERPSGAECIHTYTHTPSDLGTGGSSYALRSQVTYTASYTVEGPVLAGSYDLGDLEGPETVVDIPVAERRAVRVTS